MDPIQIIFNILISIIGVGCAFVLNRIFKRLDDLQNTDIETNRKLTDLSVKLPTEYTHKDDFQHFVDAIFKKLDRIEYKIDQKVDKE